MDVCDKENEIIVKVEYPENSVTIPLGQTIISQRCLKTESSTSEDEVECPCEECIDNACVPGNDGHRVTVKFENKEEEEKFNSEAKDIVKVEYPANSVRLPVDHTVQQSPIAQRCLKTESSTSEDEVECPCKECTRDASVPGNDGHRVTVKFDHEDDEEKEMLNADISEANGTRIGGIMETPQNTMTFPPGASVSQSPIAQRCLKKEPSISGNDVDCPCEECTGDAFVSGDGGHQVKVKFEMEASKLNTGECETKERSDGLLADPIESFFSDIDEEMEGDMNEETDDDQTEADVPVNGLQSNEDMVEESENISEDNAINEVPDNTASHRRSTRRVTKKVNYRVPDVDTDEDDGEEPEKNENEVSATDESETEVGEGEDTTERALSNRRLDRSGSLSKSYKCSDCDKVFTRKGNLKTHQLTHSGEKLFNCSICGKSFTQKSTLNKHKLIHSGEKRFGCSVCGKFFTQKGNLKKHQLTHSGENKFSCSVCKTSFTLKGSLKRHTLTHSKVKK